MKIIDKSIQHLLIFEMKNEHISFRKGIHYIINRHKEIIRSYLSQSQLV